METMCSLYFFNSMSLRLSFLRNLILSAVTFKKTTYWDYVIQTQQGGLRLSEIYDFFRKLL